ncbi:coiled-coil domain-containing protein 80-like [Scyliorhinus torazame]|uniref:coiled-coil domain-containing protein 80-like n=1 Tax=Scyliorhinus torazame TaxID=75743 RepID=UPI003B5CCD30
MSALTACLVLLCGLAAWAGSLSPAPGGGQGDSRALTAPRDELGPLAGYMGKFRLLVLAAPDPSDTSYRLMEQQMDVKSRELRCQLAARDLLLLVLFQGGRGKVVTVSQEGEVSEDKLEAEGVALIMRLLSLKEGHFNMVLLRKSMQLYERFPYAVRMEAVLETVDQMPLRKIESVTRRGQHLRCKGAGARRLGSGQLHTNNRSLLYRGMANRTLVNRGMANRGMANRSLVNRGMANRTLANRGMVNRSLVNRTLVNRTLVNRGIHNRTTLMWRSASPYSKKPIRSQSVGSPGKPGLLAPHGSFPSGRTLGKQKGSALTPNSVGKRRAESLRGAAEPRESSTIPVTPGQETVESLMVQIKEKVQQMLTAKHRNPVSRAGSHTYHRPQVQTKGSTSVISTMSPLTQPTTGQAWHRFPTSQPLENFSTVPTDPAHQHPESGHWDYGSPSTQATFSGLSTPSGQASHTTHSPEDPLIGSTLPKSPRVPVTAQPTEIWTRNNVGGALTQTGTNLSPETELRGAGQRQENPESVRSGGRKEESEQGGNRKKKERKKKNRKNRRNRKNKKNGSRNSKQIDNRELMGFLDHFRNKRRLLLITAPREDSKLYIHQRDEYLEHVCQLAVRRISMIAILGLQSNSTLKVEHYQNENDLTLETPVPEPVSVDLIAQLRRDFGMTFDEFFMVLVDYDMKVKQYFDVPIPVKVLVNYMDTLPSRRLEIQEEKENGVTCVKRKQFNINKFISRIQWKRRLLIISSPSEEEWAFQQQATALHGQACSLGIRHFILLKLVGSGEDSSGSLELFPLNGRSKVETEGLSSIVVRGLREHFQISDEHFMMLLIGKDGTINSWYLSPMWSLETIYELVDSMQLRQEEIKLQKTLGIYCLEDDSSPHYRGYPDHA